MSKISKKDVIKIANLCKLTLSEKEVEQFAIEMQSILNYVEQLNEVDVKGFEPTSQVTGLQNVTRQDVTINYGPSQKQLLQNVPKLQNNQIQVKRMIT